MLDDSDYFFSSTNPVANADQRAVEAMAMAAMELPSVKAVRERCKMYWLMALEPDWDQPTQDMFDEAMVEYAFNYAMKAACSDASHPRIGEVFLPAHDAYGQPVPGSRMGGPNPDNIYRLIGIEHGAAYELHGRAEGGAASNVIYSLVTNYGTSDTVAALETPDIVLEPDGSFVITIDADPAGARRNHLQTQPGTLFLFIRDSMGDWTAQSATKLRIRRLTPPSADPLTVEQVGERAAKSMFDNVPLYYWYQRTCQNPVNRFTEPTFGASSGGPLSQAGAHCGIHLERDEAMIATVRTGGARYHSMVAHDMCFRTIAPDEKTSSFNNSQAAANPDGTVTYVFARRDPGVANWVDMGDLPRVIVIQRWQLLPPGSTDIGVDLQRVKLSDLDRMLPPGTPMMDAAGRQRQVETRRQSYHRRLAN